MCTIAVVRELECTGAQHTRTMGRSVLGKLDVFDEICKNFQQKIKLFG